LAFQLLSQIVIISIHELDSSRCDFIYFSGSTSPDFSFAPEIAAGLHGIKEGIDGSMAKFNIKELCCLLYYLVAPHGLVPDEPQDVDVEEVFGEALNKLLSEGLSQLLNFQNLLLDVMEPLGLFKLPSFSYACVCLDMLRVGTNVYITVSCL